MLDVSIIQRMRRVAASALLSTTCLLAVTAALGTGCASRPPAADTRTLLRDDLYPNAATVVVPTREAVFELSEPMLRYVEAQFSSRSARNDPRRALLEALYRDGDLRLDYDASITRNAAQAFAAKEGNCLSLVIMTAAFAQHLGLPVTFQNVMIEDYYTRNGDLVLISGHVNLRLGRTPRNVSYTWSTGEDWVIDFLPGVDLGAQRTRDLDMDTVVAMYYNNRAAEILQGGQRSNAYAWIRAALQASPDYLPAINTLGVIYLRDGHHAQAEQALRVVLSQQPDSVSALSNLALLMQRSQRTEEAQAVLARLAQLQPESPFLLFDQGREAMAQGRYALARDLFSRELKRQPGQSEVHYWAAVANYQLGDTAAAARHMQQAADSSATRSQREQYTGKLARLKALQAH